MKYYKIPKRKVKDSFNVNIFIFIEPRLRNKIK